MRTNKKVLIESRKSEDFLTLYELEREKDIIREEREKWILVENGKKLKTVEGKQMSFLML